MTPNQSKFNWAAILVSNLLSQEDLPKKNTNKLNPRLDLTFTAYAAVLTTADPTQAAGLFEYTCLIVQAQQEYRGNALQKHNIAFSTALMRPS